MPSSVFKLTDHSHGFHLRRHSVYLDDLLPRYLTANRSLHDLTLQTALSLKTGLCMWIFPRATSSCSVESADRVGLAWCPVRRQSMCNDSSGLGLGRARVHRFCWLKLQRLVPWDMIYDGFLIVDLLPPHRRPSAMNHRTFENPVAVSSHHADVRRLYRASRS